MQYIQPITNIYHVAEPLMAPASVSAPEDTIKGFKLGELFTNSSAR